MSTLSNEIGLRSGAVRKVYDLKGNIIDSVSDLTDESFYVAAGNEAFRSSIYSSGMNKGKSNSVVRDDHENSMSLSKKSSRYYENNSSRMSKELPGWFMRPPNLIQGDPTRMLGEKEKPIFQVNVITYFNSLTFFYFIFPVPDLIQLFYRVKAIA